MILERFTALRERAWEVSMRKKLPCFIVILICGIAVLGFVNPCFGQEEADVIEYEYDELNRVIKAVYPDGTTLTYQYDKNGNVIETIVLPPEEAATSEAGGTVSTESNHSGTEERILTGSMNSGEEGSRSGAAVRLPGMESGNPNAAGGEWMQGDSPYENLPDGNRNTTAEINGGQEGQSGNEATDIKAGTEDLSGAGSNGGWMIATLIAATLTGGAVWMSRRRKQHED